MKLVAVFPPGGSTFVVAFDMHAVNPSLIANLPSDTRKDLVALTLVGTSAMVLAAHVKSEHRTFADVVVAATAKTAVNYGYSDSGSSGHLALALLGKNGGVDWQHVPWRGGGLWMQDALAGRVPLSIGSVLLTNPRVDSSRPCPLAVATAKRAPDFPDVPTLAESGFVGFEAPAWWAVPAPAKTPPEITKCMPEELVEVLRSPAVAKKLDAQGIDVLASAPQASAVFIERQMEICGKVEKGNGSKVVEPWSGDKGCRTQ